MFSRIDSLKKADLSFEVLIRGLTPASVVDQLRKQLRMLVSQNTLPDKKHLLIPEIPEHIDLCVRNLDFLKSDCENLGDTANKSEISRFKERLTCFMNRVSLIQEVCSDSGIIEHDSHLQKCLEECKSMAIEINGKYPSTMIKSPTVVRASKNNDYLSPPAFGVTSQPGLFPDNSDLAEGVLSNPNEGNNNIAGPSVSKNLTFLINDNSDQFTSSRTVVPLSAPLFKSYYNKLSHPAERLLVQFPKVNGFDIDDILKFFRLALRLLAAFPELKEQIFQILIPYCSGPFLNCLLQQKSQNDFENFHRLAIKSFIPDRQLTFIKQNLYLRKQGAQERLTEYISSIKEAAVLLLLEVTEEQVVNTILEGTNFHVRSCSTFCQRPTNFIELDRLCTEVMNVEFLHHRESPRYSAYARLGNSDRPLMQSPVHQSVTCFHCRKSGHKRPDCPELKKKFSKN